MKEALYGQALKQMVQLVEDNQFDRVLESYYKSTRF